MTDSDYINIADAENFSGEEDELENSINVKKTRGKDIVWQEIEVFSNPIEYKNSNFKKEIDGMLRKKTWNTELARNENFVCKYREKRGFKSCPAQYKLCYLSTSMHIVLFSNNGDHLYEEDSEYDTRVNYHWTLA